MARGSSSKRANPLQSGERIKAKGKAKSSVGAAPQRSKAQTDADADESQWAWSRGQEDFVCAFFEKPGRNGVAGDGFADYMRNKKAACVKMLDAMQEDANLDVEGLSIKQLVGKVARMYTAYKGLVDVLENATGGGIDPATHEKAIWKWDKKGKGTPNKETIKSYLDRVCPWYYRFDDLAGGRTSVKPPALMEGGIAPKQKHATVARPVNNDVDDDDDDDSDLTSEEDELEAEAEEEEPEEEDEDEEEAGEGTGAERQGINNSDGDATDDDVQEIMDDEAGAIIRKPTERPASKSKKGSREARRPKQSKKKGKAREDPAPPKKTNSGEGSKASGNVKPNQQTPSRLPGPGPGNPRKAKTGGSEIALAMEAMVSSEREKRQDERTEKSKESAAARGIDQARLDLERRKVFDERSIEERRLAAAEAKDAHDRAQEILERDERREEKVWRREQERRAEQRREEEREEQRAERREEAKREEKRREREEAQRAEEREMRMMMLMRQMQNGQPSSNTYGSSPMPPFASTYQHPYPVAPYSAPGTMGVPTLQPMLGYPPTAYHAPYMAQGPPFNISTVPQPVLQAQPHLANVSGSVSTIGVAGMNMPGPSSHFPHGIAVQSSHDLRTQLQDQLSTPKPSGTGKDSVPISEGNHIPQTHEDSTST
ncbi:hypothetical protein CF336_g7242 [Tilletia laevis]|nr:hypothetical protein CF336_g7242 [Tilletia laevis]